MAKSITETKDNPKLCASTLKDGRQSLYLEYYLGRQEIPVLDEHGEQAYYTTGAMAGKPKYKIKHNRRKEVLGLYLDKSPRTPIEKQHNKEILALAQKIRFEREQEFLENKSGYRLEKDKQVNFYDFYEEYISNYTKKDIRMIQLAYNRFRDFISDTPEYVRYKKRIQPEQITKDMIITFTEYLQSRSRGEGAQTLYKRFKKVVKYGVEHNIFKKSPCDGVSIKVDENILTKEILSQEEIMQLLSTKVPGQNPMVRKAFILSLFTGMRYCDVKDLRYSNIDYANKLLSFEQNKTKGHSATSGVVIPLKDWLIEMIGKPGKKGSKDNLIFDLPSYTMCLKSLGRWVKHSGIDKHISWHCARHSFAVNILNNGANIKTVASLLGHSGLKHTEKYTRAVDSLKKEAIDSLPDINFC